MASPSKASRMQWTPEADQTLLLTLMKTHPIKIDYAAVVEEWPTEDVKPTPRAVKERIAKIQEMAKTRSGGQPSTPKRKRAARATSTQNDKPAPKSKKKRLTAERVEDSDEAAASGELEDAPTKEAAKGTDNGPEDDASTPV